ncbi:MAG: CRTAC1 family protein [Meiothermus sp.]|nr:CRTAC1 family protein [Meiothermus sp.]
MRYVLTRAVLALLLGLLSAGATAPRGIAGPTVPVEAINRDLNRGVCGTGFLTHDLEHTSLGRTSPIRGFDGNGSGVALGDLNDDGLIDIVLATQVGEASVLWNRGGLRFERQALPAHNTKAVATVDVDGDGRLDIAFTHNVLYPSYWRNESGRFAETRLSGVRYPAFAFLWDDLYGLGRLDLVTASYDPILEAENRDGFLFSDGAGVIVHSPSPDGYIERRLFKKSFALALAAFDTDADGRRDIIVGNDFDLPDMAWRQSPAGQWVKAQPFVRFSKHTMSFSAADINNDGLPELFSTDMKPDFRDLKTLAQWVPLMERTYKKARYKAPQKTENYLQMWRGRGYQNMAYQLGLDATGWSWSAKFGDLDNDGYEDLYVVNGMTDIEQFPYLKDGELVEANQVFRNRQGRYFDRVPGWNLGSTRSARGMSMADLDNDGDLDIVVNNLGSKAQLFENRLCGSPAIQVELRWQATQNTRAIGSQIVLRAGGSQQWRQVTSVSGYISGDAPRAHFAMTGPQGQLEVTWPDGKRSVVEAKPSKRLILTRKDSR